MNVPGITNFPRFQQATVQDANRLADLAARLFEWTYRGQDDSQDLFTYLQENFSQGVMRRIITDPKAFVIMAEGENGLCGYAHIQLESAALEVDANHPAELFRLYVDPSMFGKGLGARLLEEVLKAASIEDSDVLWLIVYYKNLRAKAFYAKHDFQSVGQREYRVGSTTTIDDVLARGV